MERAEFRNKLFELAKELNCSAAETYYEGSESFSVSVLKGDLESYEVSKENGMNLRVQFDGRDGYAYTESFEDPEQLVQRAIENAVTVDSADTHPMLGPQEYSKIERKHFPLMDMSAAQKIELANRIEQEMLAYDPHIVRTQGCGVFTSSSVKEIHNTLGLEASSSSSFCGISASAIAAENEVVKNSFSIRFGDRSDDLKGLVKEAADEALFELHAEPAETGTYRLLLKNSAAATLLVAYSGIFSAEEAQKGRSKLTGREGDTIASSCFSLYDDPFHPRSPRAFDGEGFPTYRKAVIEKGVFKTLLHNSKTALKAGVTSTGNATRSKSSPVGVGPSILTVQKGEGTYEEMLQKLENGLVITDLAGLHAGINPISGDFSLMSNGALVENGRIVKAIDRITIAGNFFTLLSDIESVGADAEFSLYGSVESPSLLIRSVQVAGK